MKKILAFGLAVATAVTMQAGFVPYAMLFRDEEGKTDAAWRRFQREWCRPIITGKKFNEFWQEDLI